MGCDSRFNNSFKCGTTLRGSRAAGRVSYDHIGSNIEARSSIAIAASLAEVFIANLSCCLLPSKGLLGIHFFVKNQLEGSKLRDPSCL